MDSFYLIVVALAVVLLILCLTGVGILMGYQDANLAFPPSASTCPDGWSSIGSECTVPTKYQNSTTYKEMLGYKAAKAGTSSNAGTIDFTKWPDTCSKKKWANMYNIDWDGITNYNKC